MPEVRCETNYHPWETSTDHSYFSYRFELEWKDRLFADVSYSNAGENSRLVRVELVNNTSTFQNVALHYLASLIPPHRPYHQGILEPATVDLPDDAVWIDGAEYRDLKLNSDKKEASLPAAGLRIGEVRDDGLVGGRGLGQGFGGNPGDHVDYTFTLTNAFSQGVIMVRYRSENHAQKSPLILTVDGQTVSLEVSQCSADDAFAIAWCILPNLESGSHTVAVTPNDAVEIDGLVVVPQEKQEQVQFRHRNWNRYPHITRCGEHGLVMTYDNFNTAYGIAWTMAPAFVREFRMDNPSETFRLQVHKHGTTVFEGTGDGHYTNVYGGPIIIEPHSRSVVYGLITTGITENVKDTVQSIPPARELESIYEQNRAQKISFNNAESQDDALVFSQERMAATLFSNVVYPVYSKGQYIRHYTPGKWWDTLYTWDNGFVALGMMTFDEEKVRECLETYLTDDTEDYCAFVHHGTPLPVQAYVFQELWQKSHSKTLLERFYPRLLKMYNFLAGRDTRSLTKVFQTGLLHTWNYFYNSGGWDDYPPQHFLLRRSESEYRNTISPVVTTAHVMRFARILLAAAEELGDTETMSTLKNDVEGFERALDTAYDKDTGYYSYVVHDEKDQFKEFLRAEDGSNFNMGLDGVSPLVAGHGTTEQVNGLVDKLMNPENLWSDIGLSTVDQSASYYQINGYWNGAVWMPHQWFLFKALLDHGKTQEAVKIAMTALNVWKEEVNNSYNCFEHFIVESRRGAGWHQFSGLSTPVISWFASFYVPGTVTTGFDTWLNDHEFTADNTRFTCRLLRKRGDTTSSVMLVRMQSGKEYKAYRNNTEITSDQVAPGTLAIPVEGESSEQNIQVTPV